MDKLERIFEMQRALNDEIIALRGLSGISMEKWLQMQTLAMISELSELIDEVNFKWWKNEKPVNTDRVKDELVDILHFFISMCLRADMNAEELFERYLSKNAENFDRQYGRSEKEGYEFSE